MVFELHNVHFSYDERPIFQGIDLDFNAGRFYGILGPNGSGKTTLLDLVSRQLNPSGGRILFNDRPLSGFRRRQLARQMALVPQQYVISFPFTVREVVLMGRYAHLPRFTAPSHRDLEIVEKVLELTDTLALADRRITELSGGERQRVIFARALAQDTPVLLLDEATANLDIHHALNLMKCVAERVTRNGCCVLAVFQDINLAAAFCSDVVLLDKGQVVASGPTQQVLTPANLATVFKVEAHVHHDRLTDTLNVIFGRNPKLPPIEER